MREAADSRSLTEFARNAREHVRRLRRTGRPEVLTVKGKAAVVVLDARAYERLLGVLDEAESIARIRRALASHERGEGVDARTVMAELRRKYAIPRRA